MRRALHAEWTKLRTVPGAGRLMSGIVVLTVVASAVADASVHCARPRCELDAVRIGLTGVQLGQILVTVLAVTVISAEYSTGMIVSSLTAIPRRGSVLAAKAVLVAAATAVAGVPAVLGCLLAGRWMLPRSGLGPAHGYPPLSLADGGTFRAVAGSVLYLMLIGLLALGLAAVVRDAAVATGVTLGLLYISSVLPFVVRDPAWQRALWRLSPMSAGLAVQATSSLPSLPIGPWAGLGVLAAWTAAALLLGALLLHRRDA